MLQKGLSFYPYKINNSHPTEDPSVLQDRQQAPKTRSRRAQARPTAGAGSGCSIKRGGTALPGLSPRAAAAWPPRPSPAQQGRRTERGRGARVFCVPAAAVSSTCDQTPAGHEIRGKRERGRGPWLAIEGDREGRPEVVGKRGVPCRPLDLEELLGSAYSRNIPLPRTSAFHSVFQPNMKTTSRDGSNPLRSASFLEANTP